MKHTVKILLVIAGLVLSSASYAGYRGGHHGGGHYGGGHHGGVIMWVRLPVRLLSADYSDMLLPGIDIGNPEPFIGQFM